MPSDPSLPCRTLYEPNDPIPPVDPDNLRRVWNVKPPWTAHSRDEACSPGADVSAVVRRHSMLQTLTTLNLLAPWTHDGHLDEAVFRLAATFRLHELRRQAYMIPGDEFYPFDPNAFLERLVEETGIAHVWEPVAVKVAEGGRCYVSFSFGVQGQVADPEREARQKTRELLWAIWRRFSGVDELLTRADAQSASQLTATFFADFLIANTDLVQQVVEAYRQGQHVGKDVMMEVERRAQAGDLEPHSLAEEHAATMHHLQLSENHIPII
jgi:hypothetical protein